MALSCSIEAPPGTTVQNYQFQPGELISVKCTDHQVVDFLDQQIDIIIVFADGSQSLNSVGTLSVWSGNYSARFILPQTVTTGIITVTLTTGHTQTKVVLNIGIGEPGINPTPPNPPPGDLIQTSETVLKWVAIGAGVIAVAWLAAKVIPSMIQSVPKKPGRG
jgi:hypothetical protein